MIITKVELFILKAGDDLTKDLKEVDCVITSNVSENMLRYKDNMIYYNNDFNNVVINGLRETDHRLLMIVISKLNRRGDEDVVIDGEEIRILGKFEHWMPNQFEKFIESSGVKFIKKMKFIDNERRGKHVSLFSTWKYDVEEDTLTVRINKEYTYLTNNFERGNYSAIRTIDFSVLEGIYGQLLCRLLSQWRSVGKRVVSFDEFSRIMGLPKYLRDSPSRTHSDVIKRSINNNRESFEEMFPNLEVETKKKSNKIIGFTFTWKPTYGTGDKWDPNKYKKDNMINELSEEDKKRIEDSY